MTTKIKASNIDTAATDFTFGTMSVDGNLTVTGNLTIEGSTITVDTATVQTVSLGDNDKISMGDSGDLQIYHDGSNSIIEDVGTGDLRIQGTDIRLRNAGATATYMTALNGAGVSLRYNDSPKFATTATGIDVTGTVDANGNVKTNGFFINSATISTNTTLQNGDNAMTTGPVTIASSVTITLDPGSRWVVL